MCDLRLLEFSTDGGDRYAAEQFWQYVHRTCPIWCLLLLDLRLSKHQKVNKLVNGRGPSQVAIHETNMGRCDNMIKWSQKYIVIYVVYLWVLAVVGMRVWKTSEKAFLAEKKNLDNFVREDLKKIGNECRRFALAEKIGLVTYNWS